ncbi:hypothetical protein ZTR_09420 [Talaromyces verruculosus]|nr:hypothetical protein ZTR_09420 [Talaromyces verruculosus]
MWDISMALLLGMIRRADVGTSFAQALAYQAAIEGTTLLKNDGVFPLNVVAFSEITHRISPSQAFESTFKSVSYAQGIPISGTPPGALRKSLVVVQFGGDQLNYTALLQNHNVSAILWAGYSGQNGGNAILDVLSGAKSIAGRLRVTQYPAGYTSEVSIFDPTPGPNTKFPGRTYTWSLGMRFSRLATATLH